MAKLQLLGWDVELYDMTNDITYTSEILEVAVGQDLNSAAVMCSIKFQIDSSNIKYFLKPHQMTLTLCNKLTYTNEFEEMFSVDLQSVSNPGATVVREQDVSQSNLIVIPMRYMCRYCYKLMNSRVGKIYEKKKLEEIINDLYNQCDCGIPLELEKPNNQTKYDTITVPETSFIGAVRYLNQKFGFYDSLFMIFGDSFTDTEPKFIINNATKLEREDIELYFTPHEQKGRKAETIYDKKYYTYIPINIQNNFSQLRAKIPQLTKIISFDNDRFIKRQDIPFAKTIKELPFLESNKQFDELMQFKTQSLVMPRFDVKDYTLKGMMQDVGLSAFQISRIKIPNPFLLEHFKIGTKIKFISQSDGFMDNDIKLMVFGWILHLKQVAGTWNTDFKVRVAATSYLGDDS